MAPPPTNPLTWLVTGTSNGFGLALSQHILRQGHNLVSLSRHPEPHQSLLSLINSSNPTTTTQLTAKPSLWHIQHDLSTPSEPKLKATIDNFFKHQPNTTVDVLVNNAAIAALAPLELIPQSTMEHCFTVNFWSPFWLIRALMSNMRGAVDKSGGEEEQQQQQREKVIVNISSTQGLCCDAAEVAYESSKHALEGMSGVLAKEVSSFGWRVMVVNLGSFRTAFASGGEREGLGIGVEELGVYGGKGNPVGERMEMVRKYAKVEGAARGDVGRGAGLVFDAVAGTEGADVVEVLRGQRESFGAEGVQGVSRVERLVLGSDALPKVGRQVEELRRAVEGCEVLRTAVDADDVK